MRKTALWLAIALLFGTTPCWAEQPQGLYHGVHLIRGTVFSAGRVDPTENVGTGTYFDINYSSVFINGGVNTKKFGDFPIINNGLQTDPAAQAANKRINNVYLGTGFGRILQIQYGYGTANGVFRIRSDFNFRSVVDFLTSTTMPKNRMTLGDRLTFSISVERYEGNDDIYNNATWGIGLLF